MYHNEVLFVDKFLSKLKEMRVEKIPFRTKEYRDGVYAMKHYFDDHLSSLGTEYEDIGLLFLNGGQKDFATAIMDANGNQISLENPKLETATLNMKEEWVESVREDSMLDIPDAFITAITQEFCEAARVQV